MKEGWEMGGGGGRGVMRERGGGIIPFGEAPRREYYTLSSSVCF